MTTVIVEDQAMFLSLLRKVCEEELGYRVVGGAETGSDGIALCRRFQPDLLLLDLDLPDGNALDVLPAFEAASPDSRILAVSVMIDEYTMSRILDSGVDGFVDKPGSSVETLAAAISAVMTNNAYFAPVVTQVRQKIFGDPHSWLKLLTPHEVKVLRFIGSGFSNTEAAVKMARSPRTVETEHRQIMAKLRLHSVRDLIRFAVHHGLAKP